MKLEYDPERDLLYIWFATVGTTAEQTVAISPGVYADLDSSGKLIGLEVLYATEVMGNKVEFQVSLPSLQEIAS